MFQQIQNAQLFPAVVCDIIYKYARPSYMEQLKRVMTSQYTDYKKQYGGLYGRAPFLDYFFKSSYLWEEREITRPAHRNYLHNYCNNNYNDTDTEDMGEHWGDLPAREHLKYILDDQARNAEIYYSWEQPEEDDDEEQQQEKYNMKYNFYGGNGQNIHTYAN